MSEVRPQVAEMSVSVPDPDERAALEAADRHAVSESWARRLADRDTSLWTTDPKVAEAIADRLGWLDAPAHFTMQIPALEAFGEDARDDGFVAAVVAGMGGSSLAPDVLRSVFGTTPDWLDLRVLDSTDPAAVAAAVDDLDPLATLFIVATKSGTTTEPLAFQADAWARIRQALEQRHAHDESPGALMAAITDPGRSLEAIPHHDDLREVFLNPPDIGGRYSALTYVGLAPASLIGIDLDPLLASATSMLGACGSADPATNPGLALGLAIGTLARSGRDKLTFVADPDIAAFGAWAEQLLAESTGKHGVGIVPVDREPLGEPAAYGRDRVFVRLILDGATPPTGPAGRAADDALADLEAAGHPVVRIRIGDPMDLGGEFVRWEIATAFAGAVLGIDAFDQPNVEEAKELTRQVLAHRGGPQQAPADPVLVADGLRLYADRRLGAVAGEALVDVLARHLARARSDAYLAIQAFIAPTSARDATFAAMRTILRDRTRLATTHGYGPRFLHSTGQLHKGGAPIGWFLQLTADHPIDRPIPGWPYTFGQLIDAQALGDFQAIASHDLPILRVHLGPDPDAGLETLQRGLAAALGQVAGTASTEA
jgi:transaldolase/glucose-6-phosphate isomerase